MISLKGVKKVMLAQKPIFLAYPSESSPLSKILNLDVP